MSELAEALETSFSTQTVSKSLDAALFSDVGEVLIFSCFLFSDY